MSAQTGKINLCTAPLYVAPEAHGGKGVTLEYGCVTDGLSVRCCKWYKPLIGAGGLVSPGECDFFRNGCTCKTAIRYARQRAKRLVTRLFAE